MDHVTDSEACTNCSHDHLPLPRSIWYVSRQDKCVEPGCDCESYAKPEGRPRVYKCSDCTRMVTRVHSSCWGSGHRCDDCYHDD